MLDREGLLARLRAVLPEIRTRYGVRTLGLFGSYVRDEARAESDVDLLVDFDRTPSLFELIELEQHLGDLLGVKVDLATRGSLKPAIGQRILSEVRRV
jgi:predicted nucleotidyltransferase